MPVEVIVAGVVGFALIWLVLQPMISPPAAPAVPLDPPDPEETLRGQALLALKEIEFDRATGKLSEADFVALTARYQAAAIAALDEPSELPRCLEHGERRETDARYCPVCGAGLVANGGSCVACGSTLPDEALFCPGCGIGVRH